MSCTRLAVVAVIAAIVVLGGAEESLPGSSHPCYNVGKDLPSDFEASGLVWNAATETLYSVADEGEIASMDKDGKHLKTYPLGISDVESITIVDESSPYLFIGQEWPAAIYEYDLTNETLTARLFPLGETFPGDADHGMEGLAWVPNPQSPEGGYFYAGNQYNGNVYVYLVPLSNGTSTTSTLVHIIELPWETDCSGVSYQPNGNVVYAVSDKNDELIVMSLDGTIQGTYPIPDDGQEGVAPRTNDSGNLEIYIANDNGKGASTIHRYDYPIPKDCFDDAAATVHIIPSFNQ